MKPILLAAVGAVVLCAGLAAQAAELSFWRGDFDGPMEVHVAPDGMVSGHYELHGGARREGRIVGHVEGPGYLRGIWLQAVSDHPCNRLREGTASWGRFIIRDAWSRHPEGWWSYCDDEPERSWQLQRN